VYWVTDGLVDDMGNSLAGWPEPDGGGPQPDAAGGVIMKLTPK
jgi:hypothetical protein